MEMMEIADVGGHVGQKCGLLWPFRNCQIRPWAVAEGANTLWAGLLRAHVDWEATEGEGVGVQGPPLPCIRLPLQRLPDTQHFPLRMIDFVV